MGMTRITTIFNGLQTLAAESSTGVDIHLEAVKDEYGNVEEIKWFIGGTKVNDDIIEYIAGIYRDGEPLSSSLYDNNGKFPRLIVKRDIAVHKYVPSYKKVNSAFHKIMEILELYHQYIDDEVLSLLMDHEITKGKTGITFQLLKEIPDDVDQDHLIEDFEKQGYVNNQIRYWRKVLLLNGRRFWITNHVFHHSVAKFLNLMIDITSVMFDNETMDKLINDVAQIDETHNNDIDDKSYVNNEVENIEKTNKSFASIKASADDVNVDNNTDVNVNQENEKVDISTFSRENEATNDSTNNEKKDEINKKPAYSFKNDVNNPFNKKVETVKPLNINNLLDNMFM